MPDDERTIDVGTEPVDEPAVPLEKKFQQQMRQIISQKIELLIPDL